MSSTERLDYIGTVKLAIQIEKLFLTVKSCGKNILDVKPIFLHKIPDTC